MAVKRLEIWRRWEAMFRIKVDLLLPHKQKAPENSNKAINGNSSSLQLLQTKEPLARNEERIRITAIPEMAILCRINSSSSQHR